METFFIHLIKSSGVLVLFLACYHIFLKKETLFSSNRWFLIIGLISAAIIPFITLTKTVMVAPIAIPSIEQNLITTKSITEEGSISFATSSFDWKSVLLTIYLLGTSFFSFRLIRQLYTINKLKHNSTVAYDNQFYHVQTKQRIAPFSFFKHIFYHPQQFNDAELSSILKHEKVHAGQYHSLDILLLEITILLVWFNPFIWLYKNAVKQNLEFLADSKSHDFGAGKKFYQYLMLKQVLNSGSFAIANPFYNSLIKKRIVMLNKKQSKKVNILKALVVLPLLGIFLVAFNTKEVIQFPDPSASFIESFANEKPQFVSPLKQSDIKKITVGFGEATDPFTNNKRMHTGIDFKAPKGAKVMATAHGKIVKAAFSNGYGNYVVIAHSDGYESKYMHLANFTVKAGEEVIAGNTIGAVGSTGRSTGPHLHFEILKDGNVINPENVVPIKVGTNMHRVKSNSNHSNSTMNSRVIPRKDKFKFIITKSTSDTELAQIKNDLNKMEIDFSYTVVHNDVNEIIDISLNISSSNPTKNFSTVYSASSDKPIAPIVLFYDDVTGGVSIGGIDKSIEVIKTGGNDDEIIIIGDNSNDTNKQIEKHIRIVEKYDDDNIELHTDKKKVKIHAADGEVISLTGDDGETIEIKSGDYETIKIQKKGKHKKHLKYHLSTTSGDDAEIMILDKKEQLSVITPDGKEPLYFINDKPATKKKVEKLKSKKVERIDVYKGTGEIEKYGEDARHGVVKIYTK